MAHKILIVDDEPNIVISLEFLMKREGHSVLLARGGGAEYVLDSLQPQVRPRRRSPYQFIYLLTPDCDPKRPF